MVIIRHHIGVGEGAGSAFDPSRVLAIPLRLSTTHSDRYRPQIGLGGRLCNVETRYLGIWLAAVDYLWHANVISDGRGGVFGPSRAAAVPLLPPTDHNHQC